MPDKTTSGRPEGGFSPLSVPFGLEAFMEINRPALEAMAEVNGKVYENLAARNRSWADFLNRRLRQELGVPRRLAACKSVHEVYGVYADFLQTAVADYQTELEKISKLGKTLADDTMQAMQARPEREDGDARASR